MAIERLELPSGAWIEYRSDLKAKDKFATQDAIEITVGENGLQNMRGGFANRLRNALLLQLITAWSFEGVPVPSVNLAGADTLGDVLDIDDYNALTEAVAPLLMKVAGTGDSPNRKTSAP